MMMMTMIVMVTAMVAYDEEVKGCQQIFDIVL